MSSRKGARYFSDFSLLSGSVGHLGIDYLVEVEEEGLAELNAKIFAHQTDRLTLKEAVILRGERARSLIRTRVVLEEKACAEITGITEAHAAGARGHVDCMEVVHGPSARQRHPDREGLSPGGESYP